MLECLLSPESAGTMALVVVLSSVGLLLCIADVTGDLILGLVPPRFPRFSMLERLLSLEGAGTAAIIVT
jgi:hypothetical protein